MTNRLRRKPQTVAQARTWMDHAIASMYRETNALVRDAVTRECIARCEPVPRDFAWMAEHLTKQVQETAPPKGVVWLHTREWKETWLWKGKPLLRLNVKITRNGESLAVSWSRQRLDD